MAKQSRDGRVGRAGQITDDMGMHRMACRLVGRLLIEGPGVIVVFAHMMHRRGARHVGMPSIVCVAMRHSRAHASVREKHDAKHEGGEQLPHRGALTTASGERQSSHWLAA